MNIDVAGGILFTAALVAYGIAIGFIALIVCAGVVSLVDGLLIKIRGGRR